MSLVIVSRRSNCSARQFPLIDADCDDCPAPATSDVLKRQRFYTLQIMMLGGPDGQVM